MSSLFQMWSFSSRQTAAKGDVLFLEVFKISTFMRRYFAFDKGFLSLWQVLQEGALILSDYNARARAISKQAKRIKTRKETGLFCGLS